MGWSLVQWLLGEGGALGAGAGQAPGISDENYSELVRLFGMLGDLGKVPAAPATTATHGRPGTNRPVAWV
jgi:hypothetical protein